MSRCKVPNCPYNQDGRCVENLLPNCPNIVEDEEAEEVSAATETPPPAPPTHEQFYSGKKLTAEEAAVILQRNPQVIALGGLVESGKTTLLARIFEMFQSGEINNYRFMGSRTPMEFDMLSWHATMECGATTPATSSTYRSENNLFLHLRVRPEKGPAAPIDILISDIPGELFSEAVAEESVCKDIKALRRANHVVVFLDSEVLCDMAKRHDHCGKVFDFIGRALQTGQIGQHTILHLVVSKSDWLSKNKNKSLAADLLKSVASIEQSFRTKFAARVGGLYIYRLAARPDPPFEPTLTHINELFHLWTTRVTPHDKSNSPAPRKDFHRDFTRFGLTT